MRVLVLVIFFLSTVSIGFAESYVRKAQAIPGIPANISHAPIGDVIGEVFEVVTERVTPFTIAQKQDQIKQYEAQIACLQADVDAATSVNEQSPEVQIVVKDVAK